MMKYMGSKSRIKKEIIPILNKYIKDNDIHCYIEPFCGGCNVIDSINCDKRVANDLSEPLIALFKYLNKGGELLNGVSKEFYSEIRTHRNDNKYPKWKVGNVGFLASYNGRYFDGGYAKTVISKTGVVRNYYEEAKRNIEKQRELIKDISFHSSDYKDIKYPTEKSLIYCDIPYDGQKQFATSKNFNHKEFWSWAEEMSKKHIVIVSEQIAPDNWTCIWEKEITRTQNNKNRSKVVEKMFIYKYKN